MAIGKYVTTSEAAEILRVSEMRVRQFFKQSRIAGRRIGQQIFLEKDKVERFAKQDRPPGRPTSSAKRDA